MASFRAAFAFVSLFSEAASRALATVCTAATAANPPSSVSSTRLAAITAPRCLRTNFRSRYARLGGAATTGSCARCRRMSAANPLAVS